MYPEMILINNFKIHVKAFQLGKHCSIFVLVSVLESRFNFVSVTRFNTVSFL